ncbi:MAG: type II toxin-antitoxin system Phd/YefM family antitoxin [Chloroflexi bacterium]|nr:type II toxin-antitoxin system Phd/YefM family antitoxin [Chloroflexota bacterium]
MSKNWSVQDAESMFSELLDAVIADGPQMVTRRGVEIAVLVPVEEWRTMERMMRPDLKQWLLSPDARTEHLAPARRRYSHRSAVEQAMCFSDTGDQYRQG